MSTWEILRKQLNLTEEDEQEIKNIGFMSPWAEYTRIASSKFARTFEYCIKSEISKNQCLFRNKKWKIIF